MKRRIFALLAALILAGGGTFVLVGFVQSAEERALAGEERVSVYVVQRTIPRSTPGESLIGAEPPYVTLESVPAKTVAAGTVVDLSVLGGFVAEVDLVAGEQLIASRWVEADEAGTLRAALPQRRVETPEGMLELPISLAAEQALGGIITAGDTVAVVASFDDYPAGAAGETITVDDDVVALPESTGEEGPTQAATHIILHNALVVEVQATSLPSFGDAEDDTSPARLAPQSDFVVTFALTPKDVERMVFVARNGDIWLAAQSASDDTGPTSVVTIDEIFED
jgi:pilus assembly protein CpaB